MARTRGRAVGTAALLVDALELVSAHLILPLVIGGMAVATGVVAAARHGQVVTNHLDGKHGLLGLDARELHVGSLAKEAAAFLRLTLHSQPAVIFAEQHELLALRWTQL